jgi:YVTN family beta-propeller protein
VPARPRPSRRPQRLSPVLVASIILLALLLAGSALLRRNKPASGSVDPGPIPTLAATPPQQTGAIPPVYASIGPQGLRPDLKSLEPRVYVPNSRSGTVDVIDQATMKVVDHFKVGRNPQHVTPSWDMHTLYVDNDQSWSMTPIDPASGKPGAHFAVPDPYNLYFTPDGKAAIVVSEARRLLDFRNPTDWTLITSVEIPHSGPNHLDFTADGRYLLVSCEFSGYVVKVDVTNLRIVADLKLGGKPVDVRLSPDGKVFYVANETRNGVSIVDPETMRELSFLPTGKGAHGFVVSRDGNSLYVTNRLGGSISVIDFAKRAIVATWRIGGSPDMGGVDIEGSRLWVSGRYSSAVYVVDTSNGSLIKTIKVGQGPHGLAVFPQPGRFSLGHTGNYR